MANSKDLEFYNQRAEAIKEARAQELEATYNEIDSLEEELKKVNVEIFKAKAPDTASREKYIDMLEARTTLQNSIIYEQQRAHDLNDAPLISEEEYNTVTSEIIEMQEVSYNSALEDVLKHTEAIKHICDRITREVNATNETLRTWQNDLYREADKPKNANGEPMTNVNVKSFNRSALLGFYQAISGRVEGLKN